MNRTTARNALNFVLFYVGWFVCVWAGGGRGATALALGTTAAILVVHLAGAPRRRRELLAVFGCGAAGYLADSLLVAAGAWSYAGAPVAGVLAPWWVLALWTLFATTLGTSLAWLAARPALAAVLGVVGGPLAFLAGVRLEALALAPAAYAVVAVAWGVAVPALFALRAALLRREPFIVAATALSLAD